MSRLTDSLDRLLELWITHSVVDSGAELSGASSVRSWVERDLHRGDLRVLRAFAFFRNDRPPSIVVDRLCERGFLAQSGRGRPRMTLKGWFAVLSRHTIAGQGPKLN
jgi:hypothetical protein